MSKVQTLFDLAKARRSIYTLAKESTIPDSRVEEIVKFAITWCPSTYNVQSARAVILFKDNHEKFWDIVSKNMAQIPLDEGTRAYMDSRIAGWKGSYGTVMWFEDQATLDAMGEKNAMVKPMLGEFSDHSTGMHQYLVWTALEAEGLGANLQHFNFHPGIVAESLSTFDLPSTWKLKAQLVFGKPTAPAQEKTFEPIEKRVFVKA